MDAPGFFQYNFVTKWRFTQAKMALLNILRYPDPRLHKVAKPVAIFDDKLGKLLDDMAETMYEAKGIGLAATQVDVHNQVIVIDVSEGHNERLEIINPRLLDSTGQVIGDEGCLSVPDIYDKVQRAEWIKVEAYNRHGERFELETDGLLAICIQHEMDHLQGKVFVEYLSRLKQNRIQQKLKKQAREVR
jgi:peptide deformylase